jgi:RNA polymerase sigma-70 factor, ECF subfamily
MALLDPFHQYRPLLFKMACLLVGDAKVAGDILEEAYVRWQKTNPAQVQSVKLFLFKIVVRLAIEHAPPPLP